MINFVKNVLKYMLLAIVIFGTLAILAGPPTYLIAVAKTTGEVIYAIGAVVYTLLLFSIICAILEGVS